jgi:hypothetical protein
LILIHQQWALARATAAREQIIVIAKRTGVVTEIFDMAGWDSPSCQQKHAYLAFASAWLS